MAGSATSRRLLQAAVAAGGLVPAGAGLAGVWLGTGMAGGGGSADLDSHVRYLSGLLLAIGLAFWSCIPAIERRGPRFLLLTGIVLCGGLGRLFGVLARGVPGPAMLFGLGMELVVTPALCVWQRRLARDGGGRAAGGARQDVPVSTGQQEGVRRSGAGMARAASPADSATRRMP